MISQSRGIQKYGGGAGADPGFWVRGGGGNLATGLGTAKVPNQVQGGALVGGPGGRSPP